MTTEANLNFTSKPYVIHLGSSVSQPVSRTHKQCYTEASASGDSTMLRTAEIDMADSVDASDIDTLLTNVAWAICSTYHTVLKASPGAAIFGRDMLFDIPISS